MPQILLTIETETGKISKTQVVAENMEQELKALSRMQLFHHELHKLRNALPTLVRMENTFTPQAKAWEVDHEPN